MWVLGAVACAVSWLRTRLRRAAALVGRWSGAGTAASVVRWQRVLVRQGAGAGAGVGLVAREKLAAQA